MFSQTNESRFYSINVFAPHSVTTVTLMVGVIIIVIMVVMVVIIIILIVVIEWLVERVRL